MISKTLGHHYVKWDTKEIMVSFMLKKQDAVNVKSSEKNRSSLTWTMKRLFVFQIPNDEI